MQCPVCKQDQIIVEFDGVELDMCPDGHGTWFDVEELSQLAEQSGLPTLFEGLQDQLPLATDARDLPKRRCPRCRVRMLHIEVPARPSALILDRCPRGDGIWFDEGELQSILDNHLEAEDDGSDSQLGKAVDRLRNFLGQFTDTSESSSKESPL
ncbi:MAG: TFIIB-type zinc ribbon-containing protein [Planctomycetota bacterium]|jgi:Zn-finger nucleic acid-binding protein